MRGPDCIVASFVVEQKRDDGLRVLVATFRSTKESELIKLSYVEDA